MKHKIVFGFAALMAAIFLLGCNKVSPDIKKTETTDTVKTVPVPIPATDPAKISTITFSDYFEDMVTDKSGNIYALKNTAVSVIYKISATGAQTVFYTAPAPIAPDTSTNVMYRLTTDSLGNVYTVNTNSLNYKQSVIKISPGGNATEFISNFSQYVSPRNRYIGKIVIDKNQNFYFMDIDGIHKISAAGVATVIATNNDDRFAVDNDGNVIYSITDGSAHTTKVAKVTSAGIQSTVANTDYVGDITADSRNNIYIGTFTLSAVNTIYKISAAGKSTTLITSAVGHTDGPLLSAKIGSPFYLSIDAAGSLYFYEVPVGSGSYCIRKITF